MKKTLSNLSRGSMPVYIFISVQILILISVVWMVSMRSQQVEYVVQPPIDTQESSPVDLITSLSFDAFGVTKILVEGEVVQIADEEAIVGLTTNQGAHYTVFISDDTLVGRLERTYNDDGTYHERSVPISKETVFSQKIGQRVRVLFSQTDSSPVVAEEFIIL